MESVACFTEQEASLQEERGAETEPGEGAKDAGRVWICSFHPSVMCRFGQTTLSFLNHKTSLMNYQFRGSSNGRWIITRFNQPPVADGGSRILQSSALCSSHFGT